MRGGVAHQLGPDGPAHGAVEIALVPAGLLLTLPFAVCAVRRQGAHVPTLWR